MLLVSRLIQVSFCNHSILYQHQGSHTSFAASMMPKIDLAPLPPFDALSGPSLFNQRCKIRTKDFQMYIVAMNITNHKQKRELLLYQAGEVMQEILKTLPETGDDYTTAQAKLDKYFSPEKNVDYQVFNFIKQSSSQVKPWINLSQGCEN